MSIDWSKPIEAAHEDGRVSRAVIDKLPSEHRDAVVTVHDLTFFCPVNSRGVIKTAPDWTIRNVAPPMTDLSPETVGKLAVLEQAFAFVDCCAGEGMSATTEGHGLLWADSLSESLCSAFGVELDAQWPANLARALTAARSHGGM